MDRRNPVYRRQRSSTESPGTPPSPMMSPVHSRHVRAGSTGMPSARKAQTKAAAQRLAQVMSTKTDDDDDEDDELSFDYKATGFGSIGLAGGRRMPRQSSPVTRPIVSAAAVKKPQLQTQSKTQTSYEDKDGDYGLMTGPATIGRAGGNSLRSRSPMTVRTKQEQPISALSTTGSRPIPFVSSGEQPSPLSTNNFEEPISGRPLVVGRSSTNSTEQPLSLRPSLSVRSSVNSVEQSPSARTLSVNRPSMKTATMPSSVPISLRPASPLMSPKCSVNNRREKRLSVDFGSANARDAGSHQSTSALQDEVDMLQEENDSLIEKLRLAEERFEEAEARARLLEKQVATLGEGVTLEARLLSRKEAALQEREAALRVAEQGRKPVAVTALRTEAETAKDEATSALELLHEAECEVKSLRNMTQRMVLTQEEMEEVVLKRCWLARYWSLCVQHGIHAEIAGAKYEYWSSFAPLPVEVVLAAGQTAQEEDSLENNDTNERERVLQDMNDLSGDGNIESMLAVEKDRRCCSTGHGSDEVKLPAEGQFEAFELSPEESEDVRFKQAWLTYFWKRAKTHGLEEDIADERLQFWINHSNRFSSSLDAVDVERGLLELKKLGMENQLWQASRRGLETDSRTPAESNF
ncbi:coiled-coil domain-containing protein SCD2 isoform X2 [Jatropha curcas]|uniref:coiled-coil domain-containing protein SCD2 isoform X2 n=1 Tax=Jatropha curcas TaxID=180498 RepID=UPI00189474B6|nr:coiled-coil domain-containing protein SCD2 isoform X2 [Jatropha curcas]